MLALLALAVGISSAIATGCATSKVSRQHTTTCEGLAALCGRRLDEVVFAGTHNSYAASSEPGWQFANQTYPLKRQLAEGIRALTLDVHYGVYDPRAGRVRTDLAAEGADRNKVAEQLPPSALRVADRIAGRAGLGTVSGTPELYLCHTLCELGAEPFERAPARPSTRRSRTSAPPTPTRMSATTSASPRPSAPAIFQPTSGLRENGLAPAQAGASL